MINVCLFNEDNIDELQDKINYFLKYLDEINLIDIKYQTNFYLSKLLRNICFLLRSFLFFLLHKVL